MDYFYSAQQRNEMMKSFTEDQRKYLVEKLTRGKRTVFSNELAKGKGHYIGSDQELESEILEWEFVDLLDAGEGNRSYKCECGMSLRYQYIVKNLKTGEIKRFGRNHFEFHTGIPANIVRDIIKGFEKIDYELDEILYKVQNDWDSSVVTQAFQYKIDMPTDIKEHHKLELPLLDKQINRLNKLIREKEQENIETKYIQDLERFKKEQFAVAAPVNVKTRVEAKSLNVKPVLTSPLGESVHQFIIQLVERSGTISVLEICQGINSIQHNFKGYFSTGKPKAFPYVSMVMDQLVKQGAVRLDESDFADR
jgi:hypothetical protein